MTFKIKKCSAYLLMSHKHPSTPPMFVSFRHVHSDYSSKT
jgi:hypothetical protein